MNDQEITVGQARELLSAPSGTRPRIYGEVATGEYEGQTIAVRSEYHLDHHYYSRIWLSGTTLADLVSRA